MLVNASKDTTTTSIKVKFSGDGARFSRSSNMILLSFSLPELRDEVLSGAGNYIHFSKRIEFIQCHTQIMIYIILHMCTIFVLLR